MKTLKIKVAHNKYLQPGGEDIIFQDEVNLLRSFGHDVVIYRDNNKLPEVFPFKMIDNGPLAEEIRGYIKDTLLPILSLITLV